MISLTPRRSEGEFRRVVTGDSSGHGGSRLAGESATQT